MYVRTLTCYRMHTRILILMYWSCFGGGGGLNLDQLRMNSTDTKFIVYNYIQEEERVLIKVHT